MRILTPLVLLACTAFTACQKPETHIVTVKVPVAAPCPDPPVLFWPDLPTSRITKDTPDGEVAKAYASTVWLLRGRLAEALALLNGYRTTTPKTTIPGGK